MLLRMQWEQRCGGRCEMRVKMRVKLSRHEGSVAIQPLRQYLYFCTNKQLTFCTGKAPSVYAVGARCGGWCEMRVALSSLNSLRAPLFRQNS